MKNSQLVSLMLASGLMLSSGFAVAANLANQGSFTVGLGYMDFASQRHMHSTAVAPELALGYNFTDQWGIEAAYNNFNTSINGGGPSVKGNLYTLNGLYHFGSYHNVQPYLAAGLGVLYLNPNGTDANNSTNINAAIGAQAFFSDRVALRGELKDLFTMANGKNDWMANLGVSFLFGA